MRRTFHAVLLIAAVAAAACGRADRNVPGELSHVSEHAGWLAVDGNLLRRNSYARAYALDVTDPRNPRDAGIDIFSGLSCGNECRGFTVVDGTPYFLSPWRLSTGEFQQLLLPDSANYSAYRLVTVPGGLAVSRVLDDGSDGGDILLYDLSSGSPSLVSQVVTDFRPYQLESSDTRLLTVDSSNEIVVYDTSVLASPLETARVQVPASLVAHRIAAISTRDTQLVLISYPQSALDPPSSTTWLEFDSGFETVSEVARYEDYVPQEVAPVFSGDYLLVGLYAEPRDSEFYRIDASITLHLDKGALGEASWTPVPALVRALARDGDRGLAFVGTYNSVQILDLGVITDGVPRWP